MVVTYSLSRRQKATKKAGTETLKSASSVPDLDSIRRLLGSRQAWAVVDLDERGQVIPGSEQVKGSLDGPIFGPPAQQALVQSQERYIPQAATSTETQPAEHTYRARSVNIPKTRPVKTRDRFHIVPVEHGRQRGRAVIPRPVLPSSACPSPSPETAVSGGAAAASVGSEMVLPAQRQLKSFRINNATAVQVFLSSRLKRMQQLADKKIAKAWIKGICPKKQAKFPYQNNKHEKETGEKPAVPAWWPNTETVCRFVEPDHIRREERMGLCLHLLRLRPTPSQLEEWNRYDTPPSKTHTERGWTAWLEELAGPEVFDEVPKEATHRLKYRRQLMKDMYEVARMEEEYLGGSLDGDSHFQYESEGEERKPISTKRARAISAASTPDCENPTPRSTSPSCARPVAKRARRDSTATNATVTSRCVPDRKSGLDMIPLVTDPGRSAATSFSDSFDTVPRNSISCGPLESGNVVASHPDQPSPLHHMHGLPRYNGFQSASPHGYSHAHQWHENSMPGFNEQQQSGGSDFQYQGQAAPITFPGQQDFDFSQFPQQFVPIQQVHMGFAPQPEFQSTPNTPIFSPAGMMPMLMDTFSLQQQSGLIPGGQYMQPSQYFLPAHHGLDSAVADFHPSLNMVGPQYQQPQQQEPEVLGHQQHMAPLPQQIHAMPMPHQPLQWHHHHHARC